MLHEPPAMSSSEFQWYLAEPLTVDTDGNIRAPDKPGLGVEPDPEKLRAFAV
jgi:L-alanine-DL-glutamate epimerase-like enolase superfamily enzyme